MLKTLSTTLLFILTTTSGLAQGLLSYEYWMDSDYSKHTTRKSATEELQLSIDISQLSSGIHYLNFRAQNTNGEWGTYTRYLYFIPEKNSPDATVTNYEYWIDGNYSSRQTQKVSGGDISMNIDISELASGVHFFNFRAKNSDDTWGNLSRYLFFNPEDISENATVTDYEYWLDNDYASKAGSILSGSDVFISIDISKKEPGVHFLNFRALNSDGTWGNCN